MLDAKSEVRLQGVHQHLVNVVYRAAQIYSPAQFVVGEGLRTTMRQAQLVQSGASTTMRSRHLTGHAVDLWAVLHGEIRWDWPLYFEIAKAVQKAAIELDIPVEWGGCWSDLRSAGDVHEANARYVARKLAEGGKPFPDGPHFQLPFKSYPEKTKTEITQT